MFRLALVAATLIGCAGTARDEPTVMTWRGLMNAEENRIDVYNAEADDHGVFRFRKESEAGRVLLQSCAHRRWCEFTGSVVWTDDVPGVAASGWIVEVKRAREIAAPH